MTKRICRRENEKQVKFNWPITPTPKWNIHTAIYGLFIYLFNWFFVTIWILNNNTVGVNECLLYEDGAFSSSGETVANSTPHYSKK